MDNLIGYYRLAAQKKLPREHITQLVVFLEWIVALPADLTPYYNKQLEHLEEDSHMTYISIIERQGIAQASSKESNKALSKVLAKVVRQHYISSCSLSLTSRLTNTNSAYSKPMTPSWISGLNVYSLLKPLKQCLLSNNLPYLRA